MRSILVSFLFFLLSTVIIAQNARLQVIHNSGDPAANEVDVYVNGALLLDNFAFRTATPFIDVPAGVTLNIGIAPGNSTSVNDTLVNFPVTLQQNRTYVAIACGVLNPAGFSTNPDGRNISFTLLAKDRIREQGVSQNLVDFIVVHGATDAPTVDVIARFNPFQTNTESVSAVDAFETVETESGLGLKIVNNAAYGDITRYIRVLPREYTLDITPGNNNNVVVASFTANLTGLGGGAAVVFASGFLDPASNQNGLPFGLFAALPNGIVVEFPPVVLPTTARLQVIHNSADPLAEEVDVYVNGALLLDNFAFRTATPYIDVPGGVELNIGIAPGNSTSVNDTLKNFAVTFESGKTYVVIANGVLNPANFSPNPNGREITFTMFISSDAKETSKFPIFVELFAVHGSSDAPAVNIVGSGAFLKNVAYGDISGYFKAPARNSKILVYTPAPYFSIVGVYGANLTGLGGATGVVFASGFLDPGSNQNGEAFGLFAALPNGTVVELPRIQGNDAMQFAKEHLGENEITSVSEFSLDQNYPNPFNPSTRISYVIPQNEMVSLKVYDVLGNEVALLVNEMQAPGRYDVTFDGSNLASGIYFYTLRAGQLISTKKFILMK